MNKSKIEWTDRSWNPISGCLQLCRDKDGKKYCYAYWMSKRLKGRFGYPKDDPFRPTFHPNRLKEPYRLRKPLRIFTYSMGEMFGDWVNEEWTEKVMRVIYDNPQHTFQILTKNPKKLRRFRFPPNAWVGISIDRQAAVTGLRYLLEADAKIKFVSFEPLLEPVDVDLSGLNWVIVGGSTGRRPFVLEEQWVRAIILKARRLEIPVFLKDNLFWKQTIREFPTLGG